MLVRYRIIHKRSIPYEHERIAERTMGTIRRRMITKIVELKYDLGNNFYKYLAYDVRKSDGDNKKTDVYENC